MRTDTRLEKNFVAIRARVLYYDQLDIHIRVKMIDRVYVRRFSLARALSAAMRTFNGSRLVYYNCALITIDTVALRTAHF